MSCNVQKPSLNVSCTCINLTVLIVTLFSHQALCKILQASLYIVYRQFRLWIKFKQI